MDTARSTTAGGPVLRDFIVYVQERHALNQSEIARRAHLSQAVVNKMLVGNTTREPAPETYRALARTWALDWAEFLDRHPTAQQYLQTLYGWAMPKEAAAAARQPTLDQRCAEIEQRFASLELSLERLLADARALER